MIIDKESMLHGRIDVVIRFQDLLIRCDGKRIPPYSLEEERFRATNCELNLCLSEHQDLRNTAIYPTSMPDSKLVAALNDILLQVAKLKLAGYGTIIHLSRDGSGSSLEIGVGSGVAKTAQVISPIF